MKRENSANPGAIFFVEKLCDRSNSRMCKKCRNSGWKGTRNESQSQVCLAESPTTAGGEKGGAVCRWATGCCGRKAENFEKACVVEITRPTSPEGGHFTSVTRSTGELRYRPGIDIERVDRKYFPVNDWRRAFPSKHLHRTPRRERAERGGLLISPASWIIHRPPGYSGSLIKIIMGTRVYTVVETEQRIEA